MGLSELLEQQDLKLVSIRTMISEENIKRIVSEDYSNLTKAKALGFLSILEREYQLDLKDVRSNAKAYFAMQVPGEISANIALPKVEDSKKRPKWFLFSILLLLGYASWYFFTQFDKKTLNTLIPFNSEQNQTEVIEKESIFSVEINENTIKNLEVAPIVIENEVVTQKIVEDNTTKINKFNVSTVRKEKESAVHEYQNNAIVENNDTKVVEINISTSVENIVENSKVELLETNNTIEENTTIPTQMIINNLPDVIEVTKVVLKPVKRLWFGLVNMRTGKRDHFSIRKPFTIDLTKGDWLVATSPAPFSLKFGEKNDVYNNGREHYFIVTKKGITSLKKKAYVRKGGYRKW